MKNQDISDIKHLRELISFGRDRLGLVQMRAIRRGNSAKIHGEFIHDDSAYPIDISATLRGGNFRAIVNTQSEMVKAVNEIREKLGLQVIAGISQTQKSERPKAPRTCKKREVLRLNFNAEADTAPTRLDTNPFDILAPLATPKEYPENSVLWVLQGKEWIKDSTFKSPDGIERRALTLLRSGRAVKIEY